MKLKLTKGELRGVLAAVMYQRQQLETGVWSPVYQQWLELELKIQKCLDEIDNV